MPRSALIATSLLLLLAIQPISAQADDLAAFSGYVETCVAEHGTIDAVVGSCVGEQVAARENYLGDLLIETEGALEAAQIPALRSAQAAWEDYRDKTCAYHVALKPRDAMPRELFCRLRLVNSRIADVLENADFAAFED